MEAKLQFEVVLGSDNLVRINLDGRMVARAKLGEGCAFMVRLQDGTVITKMIEVI